MQVKTTKWLILILLVFCRCNNAEKPVPVEPEPDPEPEVLDMEDFYRCTPEVSDRYIYPIMPGMEEWAWDYHTEDPYTKFCQLPDSVLKSISTWGLVDALIHAPMFSAAIYSSFLPPKSWQFHYNYFNSALELFQREDAGEALLDYYKLMDFDCIANLPRYFSTKLSPNGVEMLFTKQEILDTMGHDKKKEAVATILLLYEQYPGRLNSLYPMVYLMYADEYEPIVQYSQDNAEEFNFFLMGFNGSINKNLIVFYAKNYINE